MGRPAGRTPASAVRHHTINHGSASYKAAEGIYARLAMGRIPTDDDQPRPTPAPPPHHKARGGRSD